MSNNINDTTPGKTGEGKAELSSEVSVLYMIRRRASAISQISSIHYEEILKAVDAAIAALNCRPSTLIVSPKRIYVLIDNAPIGFGRDKFAVRMEKEGEEPQPLSSRGTLVDNIHSALDHALEFYPNFEIRINVKPIKPTPVVSQPSPGEGAKVPTREERARDLEYANSGLCWSGDADRIRKYIAALAHVEGELDIRSRELAEAEKVISSGTDGFVDEINSLRSQLAALAKFKTFVHLYLDAHGVPHGDPENKHQKEGCRIGARLDWMLNHLEVAKGMALNRQRIIEEQKAQIVELQKSSQDWHQSYLDSCTAHNKTLDELAALQPSRDGAGILEAEAARLVEEITPSLKLESGIDDLMKEHQAMQSSVKFIRKKIEPCKCDNEAISGCHRCQSVYLATVVGRLLNIYDEAFSWKPRPKLDELADCLRLALTQTRTASINAQLGLAPDELPVTLMVGEHGFVLGSDKATKEIQRRMMALQALEQTRAGTEKVVATECPRCGCKYCVHVTETRAGQASGELWEKVKELEKETAWLRTHKVSWMQTVQAETYNEMTAKALKYGELYLGSMLHATENAERLREAEDRIGLCQRRLELILELIRGHHGNVDSRLGKIEHEAEHCLGQIREPSPTPKGGEA